jgi:hypothetical protein
MIRKIDVLEFAEKTSEETPDWSQTGEILPVYKVSLDKLYFNDDNGRIATWISSYFDAKNQKSLDKMTLEEYNDTIHNFIKKSNTPESYKKTLNDIKLKGQIRPGVILRDGRVVSGNRRFAILRDLHRETGNDQFAFFKCFIVDKDLDKEDDRKYIKTIERLTQFGVDEKVDYDPIDRLVDIYNDLIGPRKIWTIEEYSKKLSLKLSQVKLMHDKAAIMADYLDFINKPNKFYIAKKQKLDGPIQELARLYKKVSNNKYEWNRIKIVFYSYFPEPGDKTRITRDLIKVYDTDASKFDELIEKCASDMEKKEQEIFNKTNNYNLGSTAAITSPNTAINIEMSSDLNASTGLNTEIKQSEDVKPVLSDKTKEEIFYVTSRTKKEKGRRDKVNKIFQAIDALINSINDAFEVMNLEERMKLEEKIKSMEKVLTTVKGD